MKCRDCEVSPWPRVAIGLGVLGIGMIELLDNLGLVDDGRIYPVFWPVALGAVSLSFLIGRRSHPSRAWGWLFGIFALLAAVHSLRVDLPFEPWGLFWPAILFLIFSIGLRRLLPFIVVTGIVVGLLLSEQWIHENPKQAYFLLPFRAFQFLLGAACIWLTRYRITAIATKAAERNCASNCRHRRAAGRCSTPPARAPWRLRRRLACRPTR